MAAVDPSPFTVLATAAAVVFSLLLLLLPLHATAQEETDDELPFSYRGGAENGPERWGRIRGDWATCSWGKSQSPISLPAALAAAAAAGRLRRTYRGCPATLVNRGHDIMVRFDGDAGSLLIDGVSYRLRQMHWHSPSEHAVDGWRYDMELHMVHQSDGAPPRYAVVGQLYRIRRHGGHPDETLRRLERYIRRVAGKPRGHEVVIHHDVEPWRTVRDSDKFTKYMGSFSTPPCTEGVTWTVATKVRHVSRHQVEMLRNAVNDGARMNARPLQPANGRRVGLYNNWRRRA